MENEAPAFRFFGAYLLTSFGVYKLIPLLQSEYGLILPYSFSSFSFTDLCILALAIIFKAVLPSEFMEIPSTTPENGLGGYYLTPSVGAYSTTINGE